MITIVAVSELNGKPSRSHSMLLQISQRDGYVECNMLPLVLAWSLRMVASTNHALSIPTRGSIDVIAHHSIFKKRMECSREHLQEGY